MFSNTDKLVLIAAGSIEYFQKYKHQEDNEEMDIIAGMLINEDQFSLEQPQQHKNEMAVEVMKEFPQLKVKNLLEIFDTTWESCIEELIQNGEEPTKENILHEYFSMEGCDGLIHEELLELE